MKLFWLRILGFILFTTLGMMTASCSQKSVHEDYPLIADTGAPRDKEVPINKDDAPVEQVDLKNAYFDYDKAYLRKDSKEAIRANAQWLKNHPDANVQIEGHCDERGTADYNMELGEKRAAAAKRYLEKLGIASSRISTVSYGATSGGKATWSHNRKDAFIAVYSK